MVTDRKWLSGHLLTYLLTYRLSYPNLEMLSHLKMLVKYKSIDFPFFEVKAHYQFLKLYRDVLF